MRRIKVLVDFWEVEFFFRDEDVSRKCLLKAKKVKYAEIKFILEEKYGKANVEISGVHLKTFRYSLDEDDFIKCCKQIGKVEEINGK